MIRVRMDNRIRFLDPLPPEVAVEMAALFTHDNPKRRQLEALKARGLRVATWKEPRRLETAEIEHECLTVPRGGMARVRELLRSRGVAYRVEDARAPGEEHDYGPLRLELRPYQRDAVAMLRSKENAILTAPTGSGKTTIGLGLVAELGLTTLVVVHSSALVRQWRKVVRRDLGTEPGIIGDGKRVIRPLTIGIQKSVALVEDPALRSYFGLVLGDEIQRYAAPTFFAAVDPWPARYRIGISADYTRRDGKEFLIRDLFGEVAKTIPLGELVAAGFVLDVEVRVVPSEFRADWYGMPEEVDLRKTGFTQNAPEEEKSVDFGRLLEEMAADPGREALVLRWAAEEARAGGPAVVLAHRHDHCRAIDQALNAGGFGTGFCIGGPEHAKEFDRTVEGLEGGELQVGVGTYQAAGEGIDLPALSAVVCATPIAGNRQFFGQVRGRACRAPEGKRAARLYYVWDRHVYPRHLDNLIAWNNRVVVWDGAEWVEARRWRKAWRRGEAA